MEENAITFKLTCKKDVVQTYKEEFEIIAGKKLWFIEEMKTDDPADFYVTVSIESLERLRLLSKVFSIKGVEINVEDTGYLINLVSGIAEGFEILKEKLK